MKSAEKYNCECIECGHELESEKHCKDIKCPECGGTMRRKDRPGPGEDNKEDNKGTIMKQGIYLRETNEESDAVIDILGVIGGDVWYPELKRILSEIPEEKEQIIFNIYSPGGDVWAGNGIITEIANMKQKTVANVQLAASMATLIAVACDEREMSENGRWLIHNPWALMMGDAASFERRAKELRDCENEAIKLYANRTQKTEEEIKELMSEERWLTAAEAKNFGFIEQINKPFETKSFAALKEKMIADGKFPKALIIEKRRKKGEKNADDNSAGSAKDENTGKSKSEQPKDEQDNQADERSEGYQQGYETGAKEVRDELNNKYAAEKTALLKEITANKEAIGKRDKHISGLQSIKDKSEQEIANLKQEIEEKNDQLDKLLSGGMEYHPEPTTWEDAIKLCDNDYVKARTEYPDIYRTRREKDRANRK